MYNTRIYHIRQGVKKRCDNINCIDYKNYGGKGISYDIKWNKFEEFYKDMKEGYSDNLTIDRIDNNGNYCKENCRWVTKQVQSINRRSTLWLRYNGETKNLKDWCKVLNINYSTARTRIFRGKTIKQALLIKD